MTTTPKEQAQELINELIPFSYYSKDNSPSHRIEEQEANAKESAIILCRLMINENSRFENTEILSATEIYRAISRQLHWQEVMIELTK